MSIYEVLKTELADPAYAGMSDAEAAASINAKNVTVTERYLELKWVKFTLQLRFNTENDPSSGTKWDAIRTASAGGNPVAKVFTDFYDDLRFDALDLQDPTVAYMLNLARSAIPGVTSADIDAVLAKANQTRKWLSTVTPYDSICEADVTRARIA